MEIYRLGTRLFMIVEVSADFDAAGFDAASLNNPEVQRWEALMWHYQPPPRTPQGEKWVKWRGYFLCNSNNANIIIARRYEGITMLAEKVRPPRSRASP